MGEPKYLRFQPGTDAAEVLTQWWRALEGDRGQRAALRRCGSLLEVVFVPAFHGLYGSLLSHGRVDAEKLALVAGLAAHVKAHVPVSSDGSVAAQMAQARPGGQTALMCGLRFRRLLKIQSREELFPAMVRVIRLLGGRLDLVDLARSVYDWNEWTRRQWAFDYYTRAPRNEA
ncbi:MAG: type I-E CRISPR-associated protein Cse2/CasB [Syntrophobacteraceae bacterium]|nr:type I-E CRISPR-associated protein Cse2/CasB [Syntrophobacteraceae bacterium]